MKRRKNTNSSDRGIENLESRRLLSSAVFDSGILSLQGNAHESNTFYVRQASWDRVYGVANDRGEASSLEGTSEVVVHLGSQQNKIMVSNDVTVPVEAVLPDGSTRMLKAGTTQIITPGNRNSSTPSSTGSTPVNTGNSSSSTSSTGTSSTGTSSSGTSSTGTSSTGTTTTGSGSTTQSTPSGNAPVAVITNTDSATILPGESIHVKATDSTFGTGTVISSKIDWDFGDAGSQYDQLVGFNAAHAYDTPGTYTITLTITAPDGQSSMATTQITVSADTRQTIYVAADGNDANNGLSPDAPIQSIAELNKILTSNTRVLFKSGDTFDTVSGINVNGYQNVFIGSYGTGNQPVLYYNGPQSTVDMIAAQPGTSGLVIQGLTFDSKYTNPSDETPFASAIRLFGDNITVRDNTFLNMYDDIDLSPVPSNVLIQNNSSPSPTGLRKYFTWVQGNDIVIVGNTVANSTIESVVRVGGANDLLVAENNISNIASAGGDSADIAKATLAIQKGTYAYVYDNVLNGGSTGVGPMDNSYPSSVNDQGATFDDCVYDGNTILNSNLLVQPAAHDVMLENNLIEGPSNNFVINPTNPLFPTRVAQDIYILHNTVIDSGTAAGFLTVEGHAQDVTVDNNLLIAPNFTPGAGGEVIYVVDADLSGFTQIQNNVWSVPQANGWTANDYFYVGTSLGARANYLTTAQFESTGIASGDVLQNVTLPTGVYIYNTGAFTAGATLPS